MRHRLSKIALGLVIASCAAPVAHAEPADTIVTDDSATIVSCRECDTLAAYAAKLAAANPPAEPKTFADLVAIERQKALTGQDDGKTLGELAKEWEDSHPALPPATFADSIAFERQQVMEGKSSGDETLADLQAKWEATHGGGNSPTDPDAPPVDTGSGSTSSWSGTTDGSQPAGGWFSGGGYAADGFKQIDSRTSDGTTIQSWVSPDGMTTVTETHTSDGTTSTVVRDEYGNEIYSSITDSDGNTTTTTDGVDQTVTSTNDTGTGGDDDPPPDDPGDGSDGDGSGTATAFVAADDATGGTFRPLPAGFAAPSSGVQLAPPRVVQLGHPTNDGGDDTAAGGPLVEKGVVVDPIDGPADTVQLGSVPPAHYGPGPEFGPDGPNTELGPYAGPSTGPISLTP